MVNFALIFLPIRLKPHIHVVDCDFLIAYLKFEIFFIEKIEITLPEF